jgi:membrane protease YdiL (CAAX protease family)
MASWVVLGAAQAIEPIAGSSAVIPAPRMLLAIDQVICGLAVVLIVALGLRWLMQNQNDPLAGAPTRPNRFHEDALAAAVLTFLVALLLISGLTQLAADDPESVVASLLRGNGAQIAGATACLMIAAGRFDGGIRSFLLGTGSAGGYSTVVTALLLAIIAIGLCPVVGHITVSVVRYFAPEQVFKVHPTIKALQDETQPVGVVIALWIGAGVIAPIAEELFFRGLLQTYLVRILRSRWAAILAASIVFALVHWARPYHLPALAALALLIGYAYERTGSLLPPIVIHAAFNLKTLLWNALEGLPL